MLGVRPSGRGPTRARGTVPLAPDVCPSWLRPLVDNIGQIPEAYRRRLPPDVLAMVTAARDDGIAEPRGRSSGVVLGSGDRAGRRRLPDEADLLLTVRASTLRHHAGQAAFPGGAADPD